MQLYYILFLHYNVRWWGSLPCHRCSGQYNWYNWSAQLVQLVSMTPRSSAQTALYRLGDLEGDDLCVSRVQVRWRHREAWHVCGYLRACVRACCVRVYECVWLGRLKGSVRGHTSDSVEGELARRCTSSACLLVGAAAAAAAVAAAWGVSKSDHMRPCASAGPPPCRV